MNTNFVHENEVQDHAFGSEYVLDLPIVFSGFQIVYEPWIGRRLAGASKIIYMVSSPTLILSLINLNKNITTVHLLGCKVNILTFQN